MEPLGLYIHLPWCERKCPYCDFNSHETSDIPESRYVSALLNDLRSDAELGRPITSIFFGGGTPSLFSAHAIGQILSGAEAILGFAPDIEITLEANPGSSETAKFQGFKAAGVNRLSIGVQSFDRESLVRLGRVHNPDQARNALTAAHRAGFDNFNIDLMHGLPGQTPDQAERDLNIALDHQPTHLSWYQLTIEPNTAFYKHPPALPEEDHLVAIQDHGWALLGQAGFEHYEISAFCRPGRAARHNLTYWNFGDYLGIGAGAHGKLTRDGTVYRSQKTRMPNAYMDQFATGAPAAFNAVDPSEVPFQFMLNQLRLRAGADESQFQRQTGLALSSVQSTLDHLRAKGLIEPHRLQATDLGWQYLNDVLEAFLPD